MAIKRVTTPLLVVLDAVVKSADEDHWAYRLSQETGLAPGTVLPILTRLEEEGWLEARWEEIVAADTRRPRRLYRLTESGAREGRALLMARSKTIPMLHGLSGGAPG
jgi:PadR family transcriptional regulator PadR